MYEESGGMSGGGSGGNAMSTGGSGENLVQIKPQKVNLQLRMSKYYHCIQVQLLDWGILLMVIVGMSRLFFSE